MKLHPADYAWIVLGAGVIAWELASPKDELLSQAVDRYLLRRPILTRAFIILTTAHLLNLLDERVDPYAYVARLGNRR